jgi:hypothetical protein
MDPIQLTDPMQEYPLYLICGWNRLNCMQLVLQEGDVATVNITSDHSIALLMAAAAHRNTG